MTRRTAVLESILVNYDGPQVALARDPVGTVLILVLFERSTDVDRFVCVPVSPKRLAAIRSGSLDLRTALSQAETDERYIAILTAQHEGPLALEAVERFEDRWLPESGFMLQAEARVDDESTIIAAAQSKNRSVLDIHLEPPDVTDRDVIGAVTLSDALRWFQDFVRLAHRKAVGRPPVDVRPYVEEDEGGSLEVLAFAAGSFTVRLQSRGTADFSGSTGVSRALERIDLLTADISKPALAFEAAKLNRGHLIYAYQRLLRFISEGRTPLSYSWADPGATAVHSRRIGISEAEQLYSMLVAREELSAEELVLTGTFVRASVKDGTWALLAEGREYRGKLAESAQTDLMGVVLGNQVYRLACEEHLEETAGTGRHTSHLLLRSLQPLGAI